MRIMALYRPPGASSTEWQFTQAPLFSSKCCPSQRPIFLNALSVTRKAGRGSETALGFAQDGAVNVFYGVDGRFEYARSAALDKAEPGSL